MNETHIRSASKSVIWRITGILILAAVTYAYTRHWIQTGLITLLHHGVFLIVFYFHERLWLRVKRIQNLTARSIFKMFTYETLCGNIVLGTITYLVTGSLKQMTVITLTYIGIKHVIYIFNEFVWDRIKIGKRIVAIASIMLFCGLSFADYWNTSAIQVGNLGVDIEIRMKADTYYKHVHFDWRHKLNQYLSMIFSERESYIKKSVWEIEHKPMFSLIYEDGIFKNRSRITLRVKKGRDVWRFRNKMTAILSFCFIAFEVFFEKGRWFRNRYYIGINVSKSFSAFLMRQHTKNEGIWVIGTKLTARF